jgi:hypothetical protein
MKFYFYGQLGEENMKMSMASRNTCSLKGEGDQLLPASSQKYKLHLRKMLEIRWLQIRLRQGAEITKTLIEGGLTDGQSMQNSSINSECDIIVTKVSRIFMPF